MHAIKEREVVSYSSREALPAAWQFISIDLSFLKHFKASLRCLSYVLKNVSIVLPLRSDASTKQHKQDDKKSSRVNRRRAEQIFGLQIYLMRRALSNSSITWAISASISSFLCRMSIRDDSESTIKFFRAIKTGGGFSTSLWKDALSKLYDDIQPGSVCSRSFWITEFLDSAKARRQITVTWLDAIDSFSLTGQNRGLSRHRFSWVICLCCCVCRPSRTPKRVLNCNPFGTALGHGCYPRIIGLSHTNDR